jgi:general secretion pathway protein G
MDAGSRKTTLHSYRPGDTTGLRAAYPQAGFQLLELIIVVSMLGLLASIAVPSFMTQIEKARVADTIVEIKNIDFSYPDTLADIGMSSLRDPWGNSYEYVNIATVKGKGKLRKNKNLVPINSDYDLYSKGRDGNSVATLVAPASHDDVVRANNGGFVGLAADY